MAQWQPTPVFWPGEVRGEVLGVTKSGTQLSGFHFHFLEEGNGNPFQYSCLGNPLDREAWWAMVHQVTRVGHNLVTKPHHMPVQDMLLIFISDQMDI